MTDMIKLGIYLILAGIALLLIGSLLSAKRVDFGGLIMIGPVPIDFGSDKRSALIAIIIVIFLVMLAIIFLKW